MLRHYLPSIAALVAFVLMAFFFPFAQPADKFGEQFALKVDVAGAQTQGNVCGATTLNASVNIELTTFTPQRKINIINNTQDFLGDQNTQTMGTGTCYDAGKAYSIKKTFDPPIIIERLHSGGWCTWIDLCYKGQGVGQQVQWDDKSYKTTSPPGLKVTEVAGNLGGCKGQVGTSDFVTYTKKSEIIPFIFSSLNDTEIQSKKLSEILGSKVSTLLDDSDIGKREIQTVKITPISDRIKVGLDSVDVQTSQLVVTSGSIVDFQKANFNASIFACKDALGPNGASSPDGICDKNGPQCTTPPPPPAIPACNDKDDNDRDGKIDMDDPGCDSPTDNSETPNPQCSDGDDNDGDGKKDFPDDRGCDSPRDNDEKNPPIDRSVNLKKNSAPVVVSQPLLEQDEQLSFKSTTCPTCKIATSQNPKSFIGGTSTGNKPFSIIASLEDPGDKSLSSTMVFVGDLEQNTKLYNNAGAEYVSLGGDSDTQYVPSILANKENDYVVKIRSGTGTEQVKLTPVVLPNFTGETLQNGSLYYALFTGEDNSGKTQIFVSKVRYWNLSSLADAKSTPEPYLSFFAGRGDVAKCSQNLSRLPKISDYFNSPAQFQILLDILSLCQRP